MYAEFEAHRPSLNEKVTRAMRDIADLLDEYYEIAGDDKILDADKEAILDAAADLKSHNVTLQGILGEEKEDKKKEEKSDEKKSEEKDPFIKGFKGEDED